MVIKTWNLTGDLAKMKDVPQEPRRMTLLGFPLTTLSCFMLSLFQSYEARAVYSQLVQIATLYI